MSNPPPPPSNRPEPSEDETLAALHGLQSADDSGEHELDEPEESQGQESEATEESGASPSASGFVGMLAKQEGAGLDPIEPPPDPVIAVEAGVGPRGPARPTDEIRMAREIPQTAAAVVLPTRPLGKRNVARVPGWYHVAVPVMYTLASLLILIAFWAVGALIYMATAHPMVPDDVHYWGLSWETTLDYPTGRYDTWSKAMAVGMLICLPVSLVTGVMAGWMQKQIRGERRAAGK